MKGVGGPRYRFRSAIAAWVAAEGWTQLLPMAKGLTIGKLTLAAATRVHQISRR
jgi:hypothetical protein